MTIRAHTQHTHIYFTLYYSFKTKFGAHQLNVKIIENLLPM